MAYGGGNHWWGDNRPSANGAIKRTAYRDFGRLFIVYQLTVGDRGGFLVNLSGHRRLPKGMQVHSQGATGVDPCNHELPEHIA